MSLDIGATESSVSSHSCLSGRSQCEIWGVGTELLVRVFDGVYVKADPFSMVSEFLLWMERGLLPSENIPGL